MSRAGLYFLTLNRRSSGQKKAVARDAPHAVWDHGRRPSGNDRDAAGGSVTDGRAAHFGPDPASKDRANLVTACHGSQARPTGKVMTISLEAPSRMNRPRPAMASIPQGPQPKHSPRNHHSGNYGRQLPRLRRAARRPARNVGAGPRDAAACASCRRRHGCTGGGPGRTHRGRGPASPGTSDGRGRPAGGAETGRDSWRQSDTAGDGHDRG
jgi:hypothetical protein